MTTILERLSLALALGVALTAVPAAAQVAGGLYDTCATDADCHGGLGCVEIEEDWCEEPGDPDGGGSGEEPLPPDCETIHVCYPKTCTADADCATGLSCVTFTQEECSSGGSVVCDDQGNCWVDEEEEECTTTSTESFCVPRWFEPCTVDADCGPGFACVADEDECESEDCDEAGPSTCELIEAPCDAGQTCGTGLSCYDFTDLVCGEDEGEGEEPLPGGESGVDEEGDVCEELALCIPPDFQYWFGAAGARSGGDDSGAEYESGDGRGNLGGGDDGDGSGCTAAGGGLSLLGLLGVALFLRRR